MAFLDLDNLSRKLSMVGQEAVSQTKAFAETARINAKISDEERQVNAFLLQLGRNYFEANKNNPNAENIELINNIKDAMQRIELYKDDIRRAKGIGSCPVCGAEVSGSMPFCSYCGAKLPETPFLSGNAEFSGGVEGLGSAVNKDGVYSTPNGDSTSMNYDANASSYDITSLNIDNGETTPQKNTVSLEKKEEW